MTSCSFGVLSRYSGSFIFFDDYLRFFNLFLSLSLNLYYSVYLTRVHSHYFLLNISISPSLSISLPGPSFSLYVYNLYFTFLSIFISLKSISMPAINPISSIPLLWSLYHLCFISKISLLHSSSWISVPDLWVVCVQVLVVAEAGQSLLLGLGI